MTDQPSPKLKEKDPMYPSVVAGVYFLSMDSASLNLKKFIRPFQPLAEKTPEGNKLRRDTFGSADGNGTGYLSLSDTDNFIQERLTLEYGEVEADKYFKAFRASYIRAFNAAKVVAKSNGPDENDIDEDHYVTFNEFRVLNAYICIYASMFDAFSKIDGGGYQEVEGEVEGHVDVNDDRRIEKTEWMESYQLLQDTGFSGLAKIRSDALATIAFDTMDEDGKGMVLLNEFCNYVVKTETESKTDLGKLLSAKGLSSTPKANPTKVNTRRSGIDENPIVVAEAYRSGQSCSQELMEFLRIFQPLAEKTAVGRKDRVKSFEHVDQNRTGYASMAELGSFIKHTLSSSFPRDKAKDMFIRFRKSYMKAFQKARSIHQGSIDKENCESYVTISEFRLFNAFLCVYSALLDAYMRINENSDRIDLDEFMQSYNHVRDYGFVALTYLGSTSDATAMFNKLDEDGSGQVSYNEWCTYIIDIEIESDTALGKLMNTDNLEKQ